MAELTVKVELSSAVVLRPGHTLVVACPRDLTAEQVDRVHHYLQHRLPGVEIVVAPGVAQLMAYEPAEDRDVAME